LLVQPNSIYLRDNLDEIEASGGARSEALPLLHRCTGSSDGLTAPIHALGHPGVGAHGERGAAALVCGANEVAGSEPLSYAAVTVRRRVAPGEEPRSGSDSRGGAMSEPMLDAAGRRRSPATLPEFHAGRPPRNKGMRYPADPPTIEEIVTVMRSAGDDATAAGCAA